MKRLLSIVAIGCVSCLFPAAGIASDRPVRIVSTNVCTDQLLLSLVDRDRIASLSNLSEDPLLSTMTAEARGIAKNGARAEEIVPLKPDLVLANAWTGAKANRFLSNLGIKVLVVPEAKSFPDIASTLRLLGEALDDKTRSELLISKMNARLAEVSRAHSGLTALIYEPNGYTPSKGTLSDAILTAAGLTNLATALGVESYGTVPLERVVLTQPDVLIFDDHAPSSASRAQGLLRHPALQTVAERAQIVRIPTPLWLCAGPWTVEAVSPLAKIERRP